jgi:hypothetical protein
MSGKLKKSRNERRELYLVSSGVKMLVTSRKLPGAGGPDDQSPPPRSLQQNSIQGAAFMTSASNGSPIDLMLFGQHEL